jgi:ribose transport system ATP-binding protein
MSLAAAGGQALFLRGLTKSFNGVTVLRNVSLTINAGEVHGLIGANGSGKSTLIKILSGFHKYEHLDEVRIGGRVEEHPDFRMLAARHFAFVHQDRCLVPTLSVAENCALSIGYPHRWLGRISKRAEHRRVRELLNSVGVVAKPDQPLSELGPAEATLVAIGRAVRSVSGGAGSLLILDEPTTALPVSEVTVVLDAIRRIANEGSGVLFVSHRLDEIMDICHVVTVIRDGEVVADRLSTAEVDTDILVERMLGRPLVRVVHRRDPSPSQDPLLIARGLSGPRVSGVDLDVATGEVIGITGLVGCGKSELGRLLAGRQQRVGSVHVGGKEVPGNSPKEAVRSGIAYVPADRPSTSLPEMTAAENLSLPDLSSFTSRGRIVARRERDETAEWMRQTKTVPANPIQLFRDFSGGNQQKLVLAKWLRLKPRILIVDEPTQGVDIGAREEIYRLIRAAADEGTGTIIISSEPEEIAGLATFVLVIDRGKVSVTLKAAEITSDSVSEAIFSGRQQAS